MDNQEMENNTANVRAFVERSVPAARVLEYGEGENTLKVVVNPMLPFADRTHLVRDIVDMVFMDDGKTIGTYSPEYLKIAQRYNVVKYYTNFPLPATLDSLWLVLNYTTLYDDVVKCVGSDIDDILREANEIIAAKKDYLVHASDVNAFMDKISNSLDSFGKQFSASDISSVLETLKKLPSVSPEQMVQAVLNAQEKVKNK